MNKDATINLYKNLLYDMYKVNPNIVVTGSFATVLHLNVMHRICKDIDIHFTDATSILELIQQVNQLYQDAIYRVAEFSETPKNKAVKLSKQVDNTSVDILLDVYNNSSIDYQEVAGIRVMTLERLIATKLIGCAAIKNSTNPRIKDLYDLQFLLRLNYSPSSVVCYAQEMLGISTITDFVKSIVSDIEISNELYEDLFNEYKVNNAALESICLSEVRNRLLVLIG